MSEYMRVLNRLERDNRLTTSTPVAPAAAPPRSAPALVIVPAAEDRAERRSRPRAHTDGVFASLYDNLRATADGTVVRSLVLASATADGGTGTVLDGLAAHVRRLGRTVCVAEVAQPGSAPVLRVRPEPGHANGESLALDLRSRANAATVRHWLDTVPSADLTLVDGGALADSIDPAVLACATDGLVLVVRTEVTAADALRVAVERARKVGCTTLGVVVESETGNIPPWLRGPGWWRRGH